MAVTPRDPAIPVVDHKLATLVSADLPAPINCVLLAGEVARGAATATLLNVPPSTWSRDYMMGLPGHNVHLLLEGPFS